MRKRALNLQHSSMMVAFLGDSIITDVLRSDYKWNKKQKIYFIEAFNIERHCLHDLRRAHRPCDVAKPPRRGEQPSWFNLIAGSAFSGALRQLPAGAIGLCCRKTRTPRRAAARFRPLTFLLHPL